MMSWLFAAPDGRITLFELRGPAKDVGGFVVAIAMFAHGEKFAPDELPQKGAPGLLDD